MKSLYFFLAILFGCDTNDHQKETIIKTDTLKIHDTIFAEKKETQKSDSVKLVPPSAPAKMYSNERFKEVMVEKIGEHKFLVHGMGQIFEASFSWVIEDGHEELKKGFQMTDAGAPAWGNFSFTIDISKKRPNSKLHLILFEASPKDGSRQYELPLLLY